MPTTITPPRRRLRLPFASAAGLLAAVFALAALALPNRAAAQFQTTSLTPATQTVSAGAPFSVSIVAAIGSVQAYGIDAWVKFDPTKLQVVSVTTGATSPWTSVSTNTYDNAAGTITYRAGGANAGGSVTAATIVFTPIAAGTTAITFSNVNEYMVNYGPYGVNGLAHGASVTVNAPLPTQTLTILGGSGTVGEVAANVEYYNPATSAWQPAYLCGWHPWGFIDGTNSWINYKPSNLSDPGAGPTANQTLWYLYRVRFTVPADAVNPQLQFWIKADNFAQVAINGIPAGGSTQYINGAYMNNVVAGQADAVNADGVFSQAVHPGENTITINVGDYGGLNGFNFKLALSMQSSQPLQVVPTDTVPPVINVPADITAEATSPAGATVSFAATAEDAVDGPVPVVAVPKSGSTFPLGTTIVGLSASDAAGNTATGSFKVTVRDTTPPTIASVTPSQATIWPPNHKMVPIHVAVDATDAVGVVSEKIVSVTSSEPDNGLGDGDTPNDIQITGDLTVNLRAERSGTGTGRTYTITVEARDAAGNASTKSCTVFVPKSHGK